MKQIMICAQYATFPYLRRELLFFIPRDLDFAVAAYHHLKADEGRDYSKVWWYETAATK